jgi:hypothetical protein
MHYDLEKSKYGREKDSLQGQKWCRQAKAFFSKIKDLPYLLIKTKRVSGPIT